VLESLFPTGTTHYLAGGMLIGVGTVLIYGLTGISAGASTFLESTLSYGSSSPRFEQYRPSRDWRVVFTLGMVLGAASYTLAVGDGVWLTEVQPWRLALGGVLVGVGTRLGKGCTSGHGICGVGSGSSTSFLNVGTFLVVAIGVAQLVAALGVSP
jgi:uncharacterized membrane protein YedE/YeeE